MSADLEAPADGAPIAVLGAGSWGTALAIQAARTGVAVLWGRDPVQLAAMERERRNERYLPNAPFPTALRIESDLRKAVKSSRDLLVVVPSHALRSLLQELSTFLGASARIAWATKGFELASGLLPHQVAREVLGDRIPTAVISGPTFAAEVGAGLPSAMTVASTDPSFAAELAQRISGMNFRAYTSDDVIGVE